MNLQGWLHLPNTGFSESSRGHMIPKQSDQCTLEGKDSSVIFSELKEVILFSSLVHFKQNNYPSQGIHACGCGCGEHTHTHMGFLIM